MQDPAGPIKIPVAHARQDARGFQHVTRHEIVSNMDEPGTHLQAIPGPLPKTHDPIPFPLNSKEQDFTGRGVFKSHKNQHVPVCSSHRRELPVPPR